jgi:hypothetical protein
MRETLQLTSSIVVLFPEKILVILVETSKEASVVQIKVTFLVNSQSFKALANKNLKDLLFSKNVTLMPHGVIKNKTKSIYEVEGFRGTKRLELIDRFIENQGTGRALLQKRCTL